MNELKALFGIGKEGKRLLSNIESNNIAFIIDNNRELWGTTYEGIPVVSLESLFRHRNRIEVIISSKIYERDICHQLRQYGFKYIKGEQYIIREKCQGKYGKKNYFIKYTYI